MRDILIIGGMGSGKTTLAKELITLDPNLHYVYMSHFTVRVPMSLLATTHPNLLTLPKEEYLETILEHQDIDLVPYKRDEMDSFGATLEEHYGDTILAEVALKAREPNKKNIFDNLAKKSNVLHLKNHGAYVVSLYCSENEQVRRRLKDRKPIDPSGPADPITRLALEEQVKKTNAFFEVEESREVADAIYYTETIVGGSYRSIARAILAVTR